MLPDVHKIQVDSHGYILGLEGRATLAVCCRGYVDFIDRFGRYRLEEDHLHAIFFPDSKVIEQSPDLHLMIMSFDKKLLEESIMLSMLMLHDDVHLNGFPILPVSKNNQALLREYCDIINREMESDSDEFVHELSGLVIRRIRQMIKGYLENPQNNISTPLCTVKCFLELVSSNCDRLRQVSEYAVLLNVSSKYLSRIVAQVTGKSALSIIHDSLEKSVRQLLLNSTLSVKEISVALNFPSISSFGSFCRKKLGCSPTEYRHEHLFK